MDAKNQNTLTAALIGVLLYTERQTAMSIQGAKEPKKLWKSKVLSNKPNKYGKLA